MPLLNKEGLKMKDLYFIYGTLKSNQYNNHMMKDILAKFMGNAISIDKYPLFDIGDGFPYLQDEKGIGQNVIGELYLIDKNKRDVLDNFEGVPSLYNRGSIDVKIDGKIYKDVNCYFIANELSKDKLSKMKFLKEWSF